MDFCQALIEISKKDGFSFLDENFDKNIFKSLSCFLKEKEERLLVLEYEMITNVVPNFGGELVSSYLESKKSKDYSFERMLEKIEEISFSLENEKITSDIYSYFIYSYLELFINYFKDEELKAIGIEKIENKSPELLAEPRKGRRQENGFYISGNKLTSYHGKSPIAIIPSSITEIGASAFVGNKSLKVVYIPNSVEKIERDAFYGCINLESVLMSKNVKNLAPFTFFGCKSLQNIDLDGIKIEKGCFTGCTKMAVGK